MSGQQYFFSTLSLDNDDKSSVFDSDSNFDSDSESGDVIIHDDSCQSNILQTNDVNKPNIGSIAIQNSSDITFGDKTFYNGAVTINQYFYEKNQSNENYPNGNDNLGNVNSSKDTANCMRNGKFSQFI